ncbi:hypothetical protein HMPREF2600_07260 [Neisseria sp. HMSC077D05]|nr:hypothetical protein HMPREF2600_07260 [Neisseria sp. HMSC077D05]
MQVWLFLKGRQRFIEAAPITAIPSQAGIQPSAFQRHLKIAVSPNLRISVAVHLRAGRKDRTDSSNVDYDTDKKVV